MPVETMFVDEIGSPFVSDAKLQKMNTQDEIAFDEVAGILAVMRHQEQTTYKRSDYLQGKEFHHVLDGSWRQRIVEWMYGVIDHCSLRRDSVASASYYLDLCVERGLVTTREEYQLAAMTALAIAIKLCDSTVVKLQSMVSLGRGLFTEDDVVKMESKMLTCLKWQVHPPTPVDFQRQFLRLMPESVSPLSRYMIAEVTRFISEISVCLYKFVKYPPSVVAVASLLIALERVSLDPEQRSEIILIATQTGIDVASPEVIEAVSFLQASLEKNVSLQELMNTIHAQCHESSCKVQSTNFGRTLTGGMNSPRDVTGRE